MINEIEKLEKIIKKSPYSGMTIECDHLSVTKSDKRKDEIIKINNLPQFMKTYGFECDQNLNLI